MTPSLMLPVSARAAFCAQSIAEMKGDPVQNANASERVRRTRAEQASAQEPALEHGFGWVFIERPMCGDSALRWQTGAQC